MQILIVKIVCVCVCVYRAVKRLIASKISLCLHNTVYVDALCISI